VNKRKFYATATEEEMERTLWFYEGQDEKDKEKAHQILQCRIR
jgi:hypothetical protein